jgi:methionine synthase II (cobalamin-independent)
MKRSTDRILTTHTGSLPRTAKVVELLLAEQNKPGARNADEQAYKEALKRIPNSTKKVDPWQNMR